MNLVKKTDNWFPSIFDEMLKTDWMGGTANLSNAIFKTPAVNIKENEIDFLIEVAAPGLKKEDFNIELDKEVLTISSEVKSENKEVKENYSRKEFGYHSFKRAFTLPETVDHEKVAASYENGILSINLPKKEEAKREAKRLIEIA